MQRIVFLLGILKGSTGWKGRHLKILVIEKLKLFGAIKTILKNTSLEGAETKGDSIRNVMLLSLERLNQITTHYRQKV